MDQHTSSIYILTDLVKIVMAVHDDNDFKNILVHDFINNVANDKVVFQLIYSDKSISCQPCDVVAIQETARTLHANQTAHTLFISNFKYLGITVKWDTCQGGVSRPLLLCPLPKFFISQYGVLVHIIPQNTFFDADDGFTNDLKLEMLSYNSETFMIFLTDMSIVIYQFQRKNSVPISTFTLQARDSSKYTATANLVVNANRELLKPLADFSFTFTTYFEEWTTEQQILVRLLAMISSYLNIALDYSQYIVMSFSKSGSFPQNIQLQFTMRSFFAQSGFQQFLQVKNKLFFNNAVSNSFALFNTRYFRDIRGTYKDSFIHVTSSTKTNTSPSSLATLPTNIPTPVIRRSTFPLPSSNGLNPIARFQIGPFYATFCDFFMFQIPEDLFYDPPSGGSTRQLKLALKTKSGQELHKNSWIILDTDIQVIYGYLKFQDYIAIKATSSSLPPQVEYQLVATNTKGVSTAMMFLVNLPANAPKVFYTITMKVSSFYNHQVPDINEQLLLLTKISAYLGSPANFSWLNMISFSRNSKENLVTLAWTNCTHGSLDKCPINQVKSLASKVVLSNDIPNSNFARYLSPHYILWSVQTTINDHQCSAGRTTTRAPSPTTIPVKSYPKVYEDFGVLTIDTSSYFRFKV